jgi:hypothetical protein
LQPRSRLGASVKRADAIVPLAPVRWVYIYGSACLCVEPTVPHTPTRKHKSVYPGAVDDRQLEFTVKGCGWYTLPFHSKRVGPHCISAFAADQLSDVNLLLMLKQASPGQRLFSFGIKNRAV